MGGVSRGKVVPWPGLSGQMNFDARWHWGRETTQRQSRYKEEAMQSSGVPFRSWENIKTCTQ